MSDHDLGNFRIEIQGLDLKILDLLARRGQLALEVQRTRKTARDLEWEDFKLAALEDHWKQATDGLKTYEWPEVQGIFEELFQAARHLRRKLNRG